MDFDITRLSDIFRIPAVVYTCEHLQQGHINKTYRILTKDKPVYILQKINTGVFSNIDQLMLNYQLVVQQLSAYSWPDGLRLKVPEIIHTRDDKLYFTDSQSGKWRLITLIKGIDGNLVPRDAHIAYQGGLAFGSFLKGVSGIDLQLLQPVLPDFHSLEKRYSDFIAAIESNAAGRVAFVSSEIEFVKYRHPVMMKIPELMDSGIIPARVVHNDTKLTNIIFSEPGQAVGVIDLDTVMPGSALFDFGDAIRSLTNSASEDEQDLSRVRFEIGLFNAFAKGYFESAHALLCKEEIELLPESALLLTYIIGIRFLTDFLNGDIYYHTQYAEHNLVRARVQFRLLTLMEEQTGKMHEVINQIIADNCIKTGYLNKSLTKLA